MTIPTTAGSPSCPAPVPVAHHALAMSERLRRIQHVALDMDGTIYNGGTLFATTGPFLALLGRLGIHHTFLTNNPSRSSADFLLYLQHLGVSATAGQLYTSAGATLEYLRKTHPHLRRLFILGTASMGAEFARAGYTLVPDDPQNIPDAVVVGFDTTLTYDRLCRAAWWIKQGKPYFATNPDRVCPTDQPTVLVDCGSICAALKEATGRAPTAVLGKPDPAMLSGILHQHDLQPGQLAMVGDRLYTDVVMAWQVGALSVLVLTGEATADEAARHTPRPDLVVADIAELGERLRVAREAKAG
jgi:HAD superfamily hydrolase (TIGR01450 family)